MEVEDKTLEALQEVHGAVADSRLQNLRDLFAKMRDLDGLVSGASPAELHEARWAYLGILSRVYQLVLCAITELVACNRTGFSIAVRALIESLCSIAWVLDKTDRLTSLVEFTSPSVGKLLNAGYKRHPDLKDAYEELSSIAHPNRDAHLLGFRNPLEVPDKGPMSPFDMRMSDSHIGDHIDLLISVVGRVNADMTELAALGESVLSKGRVMVRMEAKSRPGEV